MIKGLVIFTIILGAASNSMASIPSVALYPFSNTTDDKDNNVISHALSDLLLSKLSNETWLEILDRSLILNQFEEKTLSLSNLDNKESSLNLEKLPPSKYVVTGSIHLINKAKTLVARLVNVKSSAIIAHIHIPIIKGNLILATEALADQLNLALNNYNLTKQTVRIGIGHFLNDNDPLNNKYGQQIHERLVGRYHKLDNIQLVARTEMYPLYLETYLDHLQYQNTKAIFNNPRASLFIKGRYKDNSDRLFQPSLEFILECHIFNRVYVVKSFRGKDYSDIQIQIEDYLDRLITAPKNTVTQSNLEESDRLYKHAVKLLPYHNSKKGTVNGKPWYFPLIDSLKLKEEISIQAEDYLQRSISLNPFHQKARLLLSHVWLHKPEPREAEANWQLIRLLVHSKEQPVLDVATRILRDNLITPDAFSNVTKDENAAVQLFRTLIENKYLKVKTASDDGNEYYGMGDVWDLDELLSDDYSWSQKAEIKNIIQQSYQYYPEAKLVNLLEKRELHPEVKIHFRLGSKLSGLELIKEKNELPYTKSSSNTTNSKGTSKSILRIAVDELTTALYLDNQFNSAKLLLALSLRELGPSYTRHANLLFQQVLATAKNDDVLFLASDAIDKISETRFSGSYQSHIYTVGFITKKYLKRLNNVLLKSSNSPSPETNDLLLDTFSKAIFAGCERIGRAGRAYGSSRKWLYRYTDSLEAFTLLSRLSLANEDFMRLRDQVLLEVDTRFPGVLPHLIMTDNFGHNNYQHAQTIILRKVKKGLTTPLSELDFIFQVKRQIPRADLIDNKSQISIHKRKLQNIVLPDNIKQKVISPLPILSGLKENRMAKESIDIYGDILAVGNPYSKKEGKVSIYQWQADKWALTQILQGNRIGWGETNFGSSLDLEGQYLIVGAAKEDTTEPLAPEALSGFGININNLVALLFEKGFINTHGRATSKAMLPISNYRKSFPQLSEDDIVKLRFILRKTKKVKDAGSAYIYHLVSNQWVKEAILIPSDSGEGINFGNHVAIHGETALVCSREASSHTNHAGKDTKNIGGSYLFIKNGVKWKQLSKLTNGGCGDVALTEGFAFVTKQSSDGSKPVIHVFKKNNGRWIEWQIIKRSDSYKSYDASAGFGRNIAADGSYLAISNEWDNLNQQSLRLGSVHLYKLLDGKWIFDVKLAFKDKNYKTVGFGASISLQDNKLLVGAPGHNFSADRSIGAAYLFRRGNNEWKLTQIFFPDTGNKSHDKFGYSVASFANSIVVATSGDRAQGKLYVEKNTFIK